MARKRKSRLLPALYALPVLLLGGLVYFLMADITPPSQEIVKDIPYESLRQR